MPMHVRKTRSKKIKSLALGNLEPQVTTLVCKNGCLNNNKTPVIKNPEILSDIVAPETNIAYDIEVFVGKKRFLDNLQRKEIKLKLENKFGIIVSESEISILARRFVEHLKELHISKAKCISKKFLDDGGCPWHVDATGENGSGTILIIYAGWRKWVLGSWKITTECEEQILPRLYEVANLLGIPNSIVRDFGRAMIPAIQEFVKQLKIKIPVLGCHTHFVKMVGKDLLSSGYDLLRSLIKKLRIKSCLRRLVREWAKCLKNSEIKKVEIENWINLSQTRSLPEGETGLAIIRTLGQWALDYLYENKNQVFPFAVPYYEFYKRCKLIHQLCAMYLKTMQKDKIVGKALKQLGKVTERFILEKKFQKIDQTFSYRLKLFNELRVALRLNIKGTKKVLPGVQELPENKKKLNNIKNSLQKYKKSLTSRYPQRGAAQNKRQAINSVLKYLETYGKTLWGHVIKLPKRLGGGIKTVCRTNNCLENFNGILKQNERRRSGRKVLSKDFEDLPEGAPLVKNLRHSDYIKLICGSLDNLPKAFANLDKKKLEIKKKKSDEKSEEVPLPKFDRKFIRKLKIASFIHKVLSI